MNDQRMIGRPAFGREDAANRVAVAGVRTQAVDGLGGKRHEFPRAQSSAAARSDARRTSPR